MNAVTAIIKLLDLFIAGSMAYDRVMLLRAQLETMQAEGRDPTEEEWAALFTENDTLSDQLDELATRPFEP